MGRKKKFGEKTRIVSLRVPESRAIEIKKRFESMLETEYEVKDEDGDKKVD